MRRQEEPEERVRWVRVGIWVVAGLLLVVSTLFAWHSAEDFLIKDDRFRVAEPGDLASQSPNITVEGIHYASLAQIRHVFAPDVGRSLYLAPIQERRLQLLAIDWVEDATVSKIWPDTLRVSIRERVPVAFVRLAAAYRGGPWRFALIDKDGYILRPRVAAKFTLPVIAGVREAETLSNRRARVQRVMAMLKELGGLAGQISEINAADPNDLIVAEHVNNRVVNLMLGDENYTERLQEFLTNYPEIQEKRPDATTLDLRVDGTITAVGDGEGEQ